MNFTNILVAGKHNSSKKNISIENLGPLNSKSLKKTMPTGKKKHRCAKKIIHWEHLNWLHQGTLISSSEHKLLHEPTIYGFLYGSKQKWHTVNKKSATLRVAPF
jgi:hypothetical protein